MVTSRGKPDSNQCHPDAEAEADNLAHGMDRKLRHFVTILFHQDGISLLGKETLGLRNIKGIGCMLHDSCCG